MRRWLLSTILVPASAIAEPLQIVTDIPPVQSLVAQVVGDLGSPHVLLEGNADAHNRTFRPSEAALLQEADVVIYTGEGLSPWLADPVANLAQDAITLELLETEGWTTLPRREDPAFDTGHDHGHGAEDHDDHDEHDDHEEHADAEDHDHDDHDHEEEHHDDHEGEDHHDEHDHDDHGHHHVGDGVDPHAWIDPAIASVWVGHIAEALATADPDNAALYRANADETQARLKALEDEIDAMLAPVRGRAYLVPHDALQYFEVAFDLPAAGAIALSDASTPGPGRIRALRDRVQDGDIACVLVDPLVAPDWVDLVRSDTDARTAPVDPLGSALPLGPALYEDMLRGLAGALRDCLAAD